MLRHIEYFGRLGDRLECGLDRGFGCADERYNCSVCVLSRIDIEELHTVGRIDFARDLIDLGYITTLTEIRDTFNQFQHLQHSLSYMLYSGTMVQHINGQHRRSSL